eukprot:1422641-Amphidinium_carterae.1
MKGVFFADVEEEESKPADTAEGEGEEDQAEEPRTKVPRTEAKGIPLAPDIEWDAERQRPPIQHRVFDRKALERLGMVDHFAQLLPVLSK